MSKSHPGVTTSALLDSNEKSEKQRDLITSPLLSPGSYANLPITEVKEEKSEYDKTTNSPHNSVGIAVQDCKQTPSAFRES